jgi:hypothetical protein
LFPSRVSKGQCLSVCACTDPHSNVASEPGGWRLCLGPAGLSIDHATTASGEPTTRPPGGVLSGYGTEGPTEVCIYQRAARACCTQAPTQGHGERPQVRAYTSYRRVAGHRCARLTSRVVHGLVVIARRPKTDRSINDVFPEDISVAEVEALSSSPSDDALRDVRSRH